MKGSVEVRLPVETEFDISLDNEDVAPFAAIDVTREDLVSFDVHVVPKADGFVRIILDGQAAVAYEVIDERV